MGESKHNIMSVLQKYAPGMPGGLMPAMTMRMMLRPGLCVVEAAKNHRVVDGKHEIYDTPNDKWMALESDDVWVIETDGAPGPDLWVMGVFLAVQMADSVAVGGKRRVATLQTNNLIAVIPMKEIKGLERELLFGAGQSSMIAQ